MQPVSCESRRATPTPPRRSASSTYAARRQRTPIGALSGGNIQKVVIARELDQRPVALVVAQPTRGLDVGATEFVHRQIASAAERGCGDIADLLRTLGDIRPLRQDRRDVSRPSGRDRGLGLPRPRN